MSMGHAQDTLAVTSSTMQTLPETKKNLKHPARTPTIMSAILPGAGQVYNRKYWKVPIIYAGLGSFTYLFLKNQEQYMYYHENLVKATGGDSATKADVLSTTGYSIDQLQVKKLAYRKNRDLCGFAVIAIYAINIIDANVDAHLKTFDVSDDLSLEIKAKPILTGTASGLSYGAGLSLKLNFK